MTNATNIGRLVEREAQVFRKLWQGIVFSAFVQPLLYLLALGVGVGTYVDQNGASGLGGASYLEFVAPGLLAATVFQVTVGDSLWWVMGGTKWDKRYHAMVASPLGTDDVLGGHLAWEAVRSCISSLPFLLVATALGGIGSPWALVAPFIAVLFVLAVAGPVAAWSTTAKDDQSFPIVMRLGVLPLFLFSGTFFPTANLPGWLRPVAPLSPLYHAVELMRAATTGISPGAGPLVAHVAVLAALAIVGWVLARRSFALRLAP
jgi:lipooligosaccharide transport system permease protein